MLDFNGKVAVITGAASGIGRAMAVRCVEEGMSVVLAGINASNLAAVEADLTKLGGAVLSVPTDVSKPEDIQRLAEKTLEAFGGVHLLVNNAGVYAGTTTWESTLHDWEWVLGVNLWGTIYSLRTFVPIMLAQDAESHIMNASRNRPTEYPETVRDEAVEEEIRKGVEAGLPPEAILAPLFEGIRAKKLYIFTHPGSGAPLRSRFDVILRAAE